MRRTIKALALISPIALLAACGGGDDTSGADGGWEPESDTVEVAVGASPGGGSDIIARNFASVVGVDADYSAVVENYSPVEGEQRVLTDVGNPELVGFGNSSNMIFQPLELDTGYTWDDFTQLAIVAMDINYIATASGEYESFEDVLENHSDETITVGQVSSGGGLEVTINRLAEAFDLDLQPVAFDGGGDLMSATLAGDVDLALSSPGAFMPYVESGEIDALLSTGPEEYRQEALADVPLASELGAEIDFPLFWRNIYGPPDLSEEEVEFWLDQIEQWVESDEYANYLEVNAVSEALITGDELVEYMEQDTEEFEGEIGADS